MESPWQFHGQKFGIGISMDRSLGPIRNNQFMKYFFRNCFEGKDFTLEVIAGQTFFKYMEWLFIGKTQVFLHFTCVILSLAKWQFLSKSNKNSIYLVFSGIFIKFCISWRWFIFMYWRRYPTNHISVCIIGVHRILDNS